VQFYGSAGGLGLESPVIAAASTPTGEGYWIATAAGDVLTFGDAIYFGAPTDLAGGTDDPVIGMSASRFSFGYWVATAGGSVHAFGDTYFLGNAPPGSIVDPVVAFDAVPAT